ncbi:MAG: electron transfer flavoprotein subunit beta/FixA family protein [Candidatus Eiseniibacteriota bacterium]|nr:MAG: electron transfer flavoprotein subunit beta/FixA family protein [Candidatus Eisenbacteria bacterium]
MHAVVCIKQVPESPNVGIDPSTNTLIREGIPSIVNPFDTYAIEEALLLKDKFGGKVTVMTMGPAQAAEALREALAMGADEAMLLSDRAFAGADTWATSYTLAKAVEKVGDYDIVFCGKQAIDGDTAQVGPGIARRLGIPQLTYVSKIREIDIDAKRIVVERMLEAGKEVVESKLPALVTVVKDINQPRFRTLIGIRKASQAEIPVLGPADLGCEAENIGLAGSPTEVIKIFTPEPRKGGQVLEGEPEETCVLLIEKIMDAKIL